MTMAPRRTLLAAVAGLLGLAALPALAQDNAQANAPAPRPAVTETAVFAGGCFWCVESDFDKVPGVLETVSGYAGGKTKNPTYEQVSKDDTGHKEVVKIIYDPARVTYRQLVDYYWTTVNPTDPGGQFCDRGDSYTTGIFAQSPDQLRIAEESKQALAKSGRLNHRIVTEVREVSEFWPAEDYHQNYYQTNALKYKYYRYSCGRDARLAQLWGNDAMKLPTS